MKNKLLFLAPYPSITNSKDGMIIRIKEIDKLFEDIDRTYITLSLIRNVKKRTSIGLVDIVEANVILDFWYIIKIIKDHNYIYSHSIYNLRFFWFFLLFFTKSKTLILDVHGVVPEELRDFYKQKASYLYYHFIERFIFRRLNWAVCVTDAMSNFYKKKYSKYDFKTLIYYIIPSDLKETDFKEIQKIKEQSNDKIHILYSGGVQPWQNIDLMLETIESNQEKNIHYTILTPDIKYITQQIYKRKINPNIITVDSRNSSDLWKDYLAADYAFILRDDNLVNNVACPTKMFEYLHYGLIPIILTPNIGDFNLFGFKYLDISKFNEGDFDKPSGINVNNTQISLKMFESNIIANIRQKILID